MKKIAVKFGACALSVCMVSAVFAASACAPQNPQTPANEISATDVTFRDDGTYTTTLTVDGEKIGNITEADVEVSYESFDSAAYNAAVKNAEQGATVSRNDYREIKTAQISKVNLAGDSLTIDFADPSADENHTDSYLVLLPDKTTYGVVDVNFTPFEVTPDVDGVPASSSTNKITLQLNEGEFISNAPKEAVSLRGSFEDMTVESVSSSGKNLTLQLKGAPNKIETANAYVDGIIDIDESAIKDAGEDISVNIPIKEQSAYFVADELEIAGSNVLVPLKVIDCGTPIDEIHATDITFEGEGDITCAAVRKTGSDTLMLTLNVTGAGDKNAVAEKLDGKTVKINDYGFIASFGSASFYPVFDYVDTKDNGEKLEFTLELYAKSGEFMGALNASEFAFGGDFAEAADVSVKNTGDTTAELKFTVPSQGQTQESLDMDGTVVIKAGALKNVWGTPTDADVEYTRDYAQDSLGRDLNETDIDTIKNIVGGFGNTTFGTITDVASGIGTGADIVMTILDVTGVCPSKASQTLSILKEVQKDVQTTLTLVNRQLDLMRDMQKDIYNLALSTFEQNLEALITTNGTIAGYLENGRKQLNLTEPDTKDEAACKKYAADLIKGIKDLESNGNTTFQDFSTTYTTLISQYNAVTVAVNKYDANNPMTLYDKYCTLVYNFDKTAYPARLSQRMNIAYALRAAFANIALWYGCDFSNSSLNTAKQSLATYESATNTDTSNNKKVGDYAVIKSTSKSSYCYILNMTLSQNAGVQTSSATGAVLTDDDTNTCCNFDDDQIKQFVSRMQGRTIDEELKLGGFDYTFWTTKWGGIDTIGMGFQVYTEDDWHLFYDLKGHVWKAKYYYCKVIKFGKSDIETVKTYFDWDDENYCYFWQWWH